MASLALSDNESRPDSVFSSKKNFKFDKLPELSERSSRRAFSPVSTRRALSPALSRNSSLHSSMSSTCLSLNKLRTFDSIRGKLGYEWKAIFRNLKTIDYSLLGTVSEADFFKVLHDHRVILSKEVSQFHYRR